jgi:hypothetical protein
MQYQPAFLNRAIEAGLALMGRGFAFNLSESHPKNMAERVARRRKDRPSRS